MTEWEGRGGCVQFSLIIIPQEAKTETKIVPKYSRGEMLRRTMREMMYQKTTSPQRGCARHQEGDNKGDRKLCPAY